MNIHLSVFDIVCSFHISMYIYQGIVCAGIVTCSFHINDCSNMAHDIQQWHWLYCVHLLLTIALEQNF